MSKACKGFIIDLSGVHEVTISSLADMQKAVGGYIEKAHEWPNGDTAYCDEQGLLKEPEFFTLIKGKHQPFVGAILILGSTRGGNNADAQISIDEVRKITVCGRQLAVFGSGFPK